MTLHAPRLIPETAPFSERERALLDEFFVRTFGLGQAPAVPLPSPEPKGPLDDGDDGAAPWHDPAMPIDHRMQLAAARPLRRRMMAAMGQQDCGQCGYTCEAYADSIFLQAEPRLNLCVPGGKATARVLKALVEEMGGGVLDPDEQAAKAGAKPGTSADQRPGRSRDKPVPARFLSRKRLNGAGSRKSTYHIDIDLAGADLGYVVGDSFGVFPGNDPVLVDQIIAAIGAPPDFPIAGRALRDVLTEDMSLSPAPDTLFQLISYLTGGDRRRRAQALAKGSDHDGDAATLDVLAALEMFPGLRPDPEAFIEVLEPLQPRLYSIASSPHATPGRVSLTVDMVRYEAAGRQRTGVASSHLCERVSPGAELKVYIQKAHAFRLPADAATPIIMVGPGTGIASFRAFLQERATHPAPGSAWLFFGHQHEETDFFYREELEQFLSRGVLRKLSTAWSRDGAAKVYVQDRMRQEASQLWAWLQDGAHFYVCGDALRMAKDVEAALTEIVAAEGGMAGDAAKAFIAELKACGRYQADVY